MLTNVTKFLDRRNGGLKSEKLIQELDLRIDEGGFDVGTQKGSGKMLF